MLSFLVRRIATIIPTLLAMTLITFVVMHAVPGSPFDPSAYGGNNVDPLPLQYLSFLASAVQGDFGYSFAQKSRTVREILADTLPVSLQLGTMAFVIALGFGIPLGIVAAARRNSLLDYGVMLATMVGISLPNFVISILLILLFAVVLRVFPAASVRWQEPRAWVLPTLALALGPMAIIARYTRAGMLDELSSDYVRTARAKGLHERMVLYRHVLKSALLPVITVAGPLFAAIGTGTFFVETIFSVPGMGKFFVTSVTTKDYPMIMTLVLIYGTTLAVANLIVDLLYVVLDPRVQSNASHGGVRQ